MKKLSIFYQLLLVIGTVLVVYYPTLFAEICLVDDYGAISYYFSVDTFSFQDIFIPRSASGAYYRPLIVLSYLLDKQLWFLHERLMHFESVVAHLLNTILVFYVCREAVSLHLRRCATYLPLVAALLFGLHPIMTESVNWISGRTDIMMGTFVLISVFCLLRFSQNRSKILLVPSIASVILACLAKETAFGFLLALPLLISKFEPDSNQDGMINTVKVRLYVVYYVCISIFVLFGGSYWFVFGCTFVYLIHIASLKREVGQQITTVRIIVWSCLFMSAIVAVLGLFIILRRMVFTSNVSKIAQTITLMLSDLNYTISLFLGAIGFYVKKFFLPLPLNFFILEVDPLYDFLGIAVLLLFCHAILSKKIPMILSITGLLLLLPALPFAFGTIAWSAYAERYIYLSSAFWIIALCLWCGSWLNTNPGRKSLVAVMVAIVCFSAAVVTFRRNIVWQSNVTLMRDTVAQTPKIRKLRNIYIKALLDKGLTDEALKQYRLAAASLPSPDHDEQADLMIGSKLVGAERYNEALQLYQEGLLRTKFKSRQLLKAVISLLQTMHASDKVTCQDKVRLVELQKSYSKIITGIYPDNFVSR